MTQPMSIVEHLRRHVDHGADPRPPHVRTWHPFGLLPQFSRDPVGVMLGMAQTHGDLVSFRMGPKQAYLLRSPADIKRVLVDRHRSYGKNTRGYDKMRVFMGQGLVTSEGDVWRRQRRIAQPAFHRKRIAGFAETMGALSETLAKEWEAKAMRDEPFDFAHDMMRYTLWVVASTVLSIDVGDQAQQVGEDVGELLSYFQHTVTQLIPVDELLPTARSRRVSAAMERLDAVVYGVIDRRRRGLDEGHDLLTMLLEARDEETGEGMSDLQLRDEVMTMFLAGHETTANALAWTLLLLGRHPEVLAKVHAELDEVLDGRAPTLDDLPAMSYLGQVLDEGMRLYPPAWLIARSVDEDDELSGFPIRKGSYVFFSPFVSHRNPTYFPDPERFDPERFSPETIKSRPRYAYFPFAGGPRQCIGDAFAKMEAKILLAVLLSQFTLEIDPDHPIALSPSVTLRPTHGIKGR
ncbi:MAG: cytochrome P450, partial [Nannocystaceae bacterium]